MYNRLMSDEEFKVYYENMMEDYKNMWGFNKKDEPNTELKTGGIPACEEKPSIFKTLKTKTHKENKDGVIFVYQLSPISPNYEELSLYSRSVWVSAKSKYGKIITKEFSVMDYELNLPMTDLDVVFKDKLKGMPEELEEFDRKFLEEQNRKVFCKECKYCFFDTQTGYVCFEKDPVEVITPIEREQQYPKCEEKNRWNKCNSFTPKE